MPGEVPNEEGSPSLDHEPPAPGVAPDGDQASPVANEAGLVALGQQVDAANARSRRGGKGKHGAKTRHRGLKWGLGIAALVILVVAGSVAGYAWYLNNEVTRVSVKNLSTGPTKGVDAGTENILMVGSTSRCALKVQNPAYGLCSEGVTGVNSDVVMILHLNPTTPSVSLLSLPRDLFVPNARADGANKIDAALVEGPSQLVAAIEEDFGIPIQHYVELNFDSFANVVNALGGIKMYFPEPVYDAYSGLNIQTTGCIQLDGIQALQVVRARHLQYKGPGVTTTDPAYWPQEGQSDLARIRRDHEFLRVLAAAVDKRGLSDPATDLSLIGALAPQLTVDSGLSSSHMVNLVLDYHGVKVGKAPQLTVPVLVDQFGNYVYQGGNYGDIEFPDQPQDRSVVDQFLGVSADTDTMNGGPLPAPGSVTVSVLNGSGTTDQATETAAAFTQLGFKVVATGDSAPVGDESETVVTYAHKTATDEAAAQLVAQSITGSVILALGATSNGAQVTVTTGSNFAVVPPGSLPSATTRTTAPRAHATVTKGSTTSTLGSVAPTTTTTTQPASIANGTFSAPSKAIEALAPWDPRSCSASGGEGP